MLILKIIIPDYLKKIIERLSENGFPTYVVGGSVRDILMNKEPVDWDIATLAEPQEVISVFSDKKVLKTGEKFGTVTIVENEGIVEVTTFRSEGNYTDGRHPDRVRFEKNIETDLSRRDFTINAIAYNVESGFIDPYGGVVDIRNKILKAVGDPKERFSEDHLRMMRAVRFYAVLSFKMELNTRNAIKDLAENIKKVSPERVSAELSQILMSENPAKGVKMLLDTTLIKHLMPETHIVLEHEKSNKDFLDCILCILDNTPKILHIRLAALFLKPNAAIKMDTHGETFTIIMKRLCFSNDLIKKVAMLIRASEDFNFSTERLYIKRTIRNIGKRNIHDLIKFMESIVYCSGEKKHIEAITIIKRTIDEILKNKEPINISDLNIDGNGIKRLGIDEGIIVGEILEYLMDVVLIEPKLNRKDLLIEIIKDKWM